MRKDARLHGELDRLPQLAWLLFLHAFDEVEQDRAAAVQRITVMLHH
jgi:type I restriction enzyme M protein